MAKQRYGINDGYRGAVGTVVGYEWRGQWCLRAKPRRVRNPRTERQRLARGLFAQVSQLASRMAAALRIGMHTEAVKAHRTECNHFMSVNKGRFALEGGRLRVDYEGLVLSAGPVAPVGFREPAINGSRVTVLFERNPQHLCSSGDDQVYLYAWCEALDEGVLSVPAYRRSRAVTVELPERWAGCEVHLYGFVEDYAGRTADSTYIGCGRVPYGERAVPPVDTRSRQLLSAAAPADSLAAGRDGCGGRSAPDAGEEDRRRTVVKECEFTRRC